MRDVVHTVAASIVSIETDSGTGTGVAVRVRDQDRILTCAHVVKGAQVIEVVVRSEDEEGRYHFARHVGTVDRVNERRDLASLVVSGVSLSSVLPFAKQSPDLYDRLVIVANQNGRHAVGLEGRVQGVNGSTGCAEDNGLLIFSGLSISGGSGGAVCDIEGSLVGIVTHFMYDGDQPVHGMGVAVPLGALRAFLSRRERRQARPGQAGALVTASDPGSASDRPGPDVRRD